MGKRIILFIIAGVICITAIGVISYELGLKNASKEIEKRIVDDTLMGESIDKIDYPLIDIAFNDGNEYAVLIVNGIYSDERTYMICRDGKNLQFDKEYLLIHTFPAGRGTTGNGSVVVYRNGEEIRNIEFFEIFFENEELRNKFERISEKEFEKFIKNIKWFLVLT